MNTWSIEVSNLNVTVSKCHCLSSLANGGDSLRPEWTALVNRRIKLVWELHIEYTHLLLWGWVLCFWFVSSLSSSIWLCLRNVKEVNFIGFMMSVHKVCQEPQENVLARLSSYFKLRRLTNYVMLNQLVLQLLLQLWLLLLLVVLVCVLSQHLEHLLLSLLQFLWLIITFRSITRIGIGHFHHLRELVLLRFLNT